MTTPFSTIEIQLVQSSLSTKTDEELAEILERPVEEIRTLINEITGGQADERARDVAVYIDEKQKATEAKKKKVIRKVYVVEKKVKEEKIMREREKDATTIAHQEMIRRKELASRPMNKIRENREVDWSKMKTVLVAKGTYAVVEKTVSNAAAQLQYQMNLEKKSTLEKELNSRFKNKQLKNGSPKI